MKLWTLTAALFYITIVNAQHGTAMPGGKVRSDTFRKTTSASKINPYQPSKPTRKENTKIKAANIKQAAKTQFQYFIIKADSNSYGYSIYADGNLYIQQNTIPGVAGSRAFTDTATAGRTARLVIKKIKQGEMPPTISINDLKKIGALK